MVSIQQNESAVLFEIRRIGASARVACIDPKTGVEAIAIAPASSPERVLKHIGLSKLRYKLRQLGLEF